MTIRKITGIGLLSLLPLFAARGQAFAWGNTWMGIGLEQTVNAAHWKLGFLRYNAAFVLSNAGYDSDIYYGSLDHRVSDFTFSAGPDLHVFLPLKKRVVFEISESPRYVFYRKTDRERSWNNAFAGNAHVVFDRLYFRAGGVLGDAKERLSTELNVNVRMKTEGVSGLVLWQASKGTSFTLQYQWSKYKYENLSDEFPDIRASLDRTQSQVDFTAYLQQRSRVRFYLAGRYGSYIFAERVSSFKDSHSYNASAGLEFLAPEGGFEGLTAGLRGSIDLGYKRLNFLNPLLKDYSGLSGNAAISVGIMKLTALRLFFAMGPQFSAYTGLAYYRQTAFGAGLSRSLTKHAAITYDFGYSRNDYPAADVVTGDNPERRSADKYLTHAIRLNFNVRRDFEISLLADLGSRDSKLAPHMKSTRAFIGLSLTYGYAGVASSMPTGPAS